MSWFNGPLLSLDFETTSVDALTCRPVTVALVAVDASTGGTGTFHHVVDCGVDVPDEAAAIHGYTTERVRAEGRAPAPVIAHVLDTIGAHMEAGHPVIAFNASYDLTVLTAEAARHDLDVPDFRPIIDPLVIDKAVDKYRKGRRTLTASADHYNVTLDGAHDAAADALCAARLAWRIGQIPPVSDMTLDELHDAQVGWAAEQAASLAEYFRSQGKPADDVDGSWPLRR